MDFPRRRAELLASLSPEGRATYEVLRAQLSRDVDRSFAESKTRLEKAVETAFGDLHTKLDRTIGDLRWKVRSDDGRRCAPAAAAPVSSATSSTTSLRRTASTTNWDAASVLTATPTRAPAAAASASSSTTASTWSTASSTSWGATSLRAPTATDNFTPTTTSAPSGSSGIALCVASSTGAIGVPPSTALSDAGQVLDAPTTCSTLGLYPVASAIQVNKAPLTVTDEFLTAPTGVEFPPTVIHSFLGPGRDSEFVHTAAPEVLEFGTQSSSTATLDAVSELVAPVGSNKVHGDEAIDFTTLAPTTCSAECFASNISVPSAGFSTTHATPSVLLPAAASALSPELMAQVQVPPSTLSTVSVHEDTLDTLDIDDTNGVEGMSLTTPAPIGNRTSQPMQWFEDRGFHMPTATKYLTISTYSLLLLLPPVALDTIDTTMTDDLVQHEDSTLVQHATIPCEFPSSGAWQFFPRKIPKIATAMGCLPLVQWDDKRVWLGPVPVNMTLPCFTFLPSITPETCYPWRPPDSAGFLGTIPGLLLAVDVSPMQGTWFHKEYTCCFQQGRLQDVLDGLFQILECYPIVINYDPGDVQLLGDIVFFPLLAKPPDYGQIPGQYILQHRRFLQVQLRRNILVEFVKLQPWPSRWLCLWTDMETRHSYTFFSDPEQLQADEMSNPTFIRDSLLLNPWLLVESSCARTDFGGSGTLDNMSGILPCSLPPAETPDTYGTCGTLMHPHSRMDIIFLGVPVVWSHFKMDTFTEFQSAERTLILEARMMHVAVHLLKSVIRNILRRPTSYLSCWDSMTAGSEFFSWNIAWSLCYDFHVLDNISMRFLGECSAAVIWCRFFQMHVEFSDNIYLKIMVQCSFLELVSCTLSQAHVSDFYHIHLVQLRFDFTCLMIWKIASEPCSMCTVVVSSFPCTFFRSLNHWYMLGQSSAFLMIDGFLQDWVSSCLSLSGSEKFQWAIAWSVKGECSETANSVVDQVAVEYTCYTSFRTTWACSLLDNMKRNKCQKLVHALILALCVILVIGAELQSQPPTHQYVEPPKDSKQNKSLYEPPSWPTQKVELAWDPENWKLLGLPNGNYKHVKAKGGQTFVALTYCCGHFFGGSATRSTSTKFVLTKTTTSAPFSTGTPMATMTTISTSLKVKQVPWDPGKLSWFRLEGKPNFMEGGLSATRASLGLPGLSATTEPTKESWTTYTEGDGCGQLGLEADGRRLRPRACVCWLLFIFLLIPYLPLSFLL